MKKLDIHYVHDRFDSDVENGWIPPSLEGRSCRCHLMAPCSYCVIDDSYFDEWLMDKEVTIVETKK